MTKANVITRTKEDLSCWRSASWHSQHEVENRPLHSRIWRGGVDIGYREELLKTGFSCEIEDPRNSVAESRSPEIRIESPLQPPLVGSLWFFFRVGLGEATKFDRQKRLLTQKRDTSDNGDARWLTKETPIQSRFRSCEASSIRGYTILTIILWYGLLSPFNNQITVLAEGHAKDFFSGIN